MDRAAAMAAAGFLVAASATAQMEGVARVPVDPGAICQALGEWYSENDVEERITVTVRTGGRDGVGGVTRRESMVLRLWDGRGEPSRAAELELGGLTVWADGASVRAVHRRDEGAYFEAEVGDRGVLATLQRVLPPIPAPQLAMVFGDGRGCPGALAYAPELRWEKGMLDAESRPAVAWLAGVGAGDVRVRLEVELEPPRLRGYVIDLGEDEVRIEGEVRRAGEPEGAPGVDVSGRHRVATVADLEPAPGSIRIGDVMAQMLVHPVDGASPGVAVPLEPIRGPSVVVLFREWNRDTAAALGVAREAVEGFEGFAVSPVAVLDLSDGGGDARSRVDAIVPRVAPMALRYSVDAERTIERINVHAKVALVVIDERQVVRMAERIDNFTALDEPGVMGARIVAALTSR